MSKNFEFSAKQILLRKVGILVLSEKEGEKITEGERILSLRKMRIKNE